MRFNIKVKIWEFEQNLMQKYWFSPKNCKFFSDPKSGHDSNFECHKNAFNQGNKTPALLYIGVDISKFLKNFNASNVTKYYEEQCFKVLFWQLLLWKSLISKLKNITNVASVRIGNLTSMRIAMASPMQSKATLWGNYEWHTMRYRIGSVRIRGLY